MGYLKQMYHMLKMRMMLTDKEKEACTILSELRYDSNGSYYKCKENDDVLERAREKLDGLDPIEFMKKIFDDASWKEDTDIAQIDNLK